MNEQEARAAVFAAIDVSYFIPESENFDLAWTSEVNAALDAYRTACRAQMPCSMEWVRQWFNVPGTYLQGACTCPSCEAQTGSTQTGEARGGGG